MAEQKCPSCGAPNADNAAFCRYCGEAQPQQQNSAPQQPQPQPFQQQNNYQAPPPPVYNVTHTYQPAPSDKSKTTAIILCILGFFGVAGIHRFYVGKPVSGILYLLTGGWCGIGTIIDLVMIASGTFKDGNGLPLLN